MVYAKLERLAFGPGLVQCPGRSNNFCCILFEIKAKYFSNRRYGGVLELISEAMYYGGLQICIFTFTSADGVVFDLFDCIQD